MTTIEETFINEGRDILADKIESLLGNFLVYWDSVDNAHLNARTAWVVIDGCGYAKSEVTIKGEKIEIIHKYPGCPDTQEFEEKCRLVVRLARMEDLIRRGFAWVAESRIAEKTA